MKQPFLRVIGVAIVLFATITQLARAEVRPVCSASSIAGAYGFTLTGSYMQTLYAISGRFVSNGKGALTGSATQTVGGNISTNGFTASYEVKADCTGTAVLSFDGGAQSSLSFTIVSNGQEVLMIDTDSGTVETGNAKRQFNPF